MRNRTATRRIGVMTGSLEVAAEKLLNMQSWLYLGQWWKVSGILVADEGASFIYKIYMSTMLTFKLGAIMSLFAYK